MNREGVAAWLSSIEERAGVVLSVRGLLILLALAGAPGPMQHRALVAAAGLRKPAVTRIGKSLADAGLITKRRTNKDGRDVLYEITDKGRAAIALSALSKGAAA